MGALWMIAIGIGGIAQLNNNTFGGYPLGDTAGTLTIAGLLLRNTVGGVETVFVGAIAGNVLQ